MEFAKPISLPLQDGELDKINAHLTTLEPQDILRWAIDHLPNLFQTTAFGLTGCAGVDMLSKITSTPPPLIFVDTLYHFKETHELIKDVEDKYGFKVTIYKPEGCETAEDFEAKHGQKLWETDAEAYDFLVKVEPAQRAYQELNVKVAITGRRASQGADRASLKPLELDSTGLLKLQPFYAWSFAQVQSYIQENNVPRNKLLDQGYRSVGDWHSTIKSGDGDAGERAGRWAGQQKTECGLHKDYFQMKLAMAKKKKEEERRKAAEAAAAAAPSEVTASA